MKNYLPVLLCILCFFNPENAVSQNSTAPCASDYLNQKNLQDPLLFQLHQAYEENILQVFQQKKSIDPLQENIKTLPTVLHIIHNGGPENISDAEAQQAILWLNQALANQGNFNQGSGVDCGIQLCLAQRTSDGLPTNGITRNQSLLTEMNIESDDILAKNLNRWKTKDYVNIWIVRSICSDTYGCGVVGYAYYPYAHGSIIDGIVIEASYVTQLGKISGLAHEMGHYLGLYHSFKGGCANNNCLTDGDRICDTPPDQSTVSVPCGHTLSTCSTDTQSGPFNTDQPDMSWNFMDYGIIACFHDFTPDQATRMNATLDGVRHSLLDSKGCLPPCPAPVIAGFTASATTVAMGETVSFSNTSLNAGACNWTVNGTSFGNQVNAAYTFPSPGTYIVNLTVQSANSALCDPDDALMTIQVTCPVTAAFTVSELAPDENEPITLTNTSQNALQNEWFINGVSQGATLDSFVFDSPGLYKIRLETSNGVCGATTTVEIFVQEVCNGTNQLYQIAYQDASSYNFYGKKVLELKDGNLLFVIDNSQNNGKLYLTKLTPGGQQIWAKIIEGDSTEYSNMGAAATTSDGGFVIGLKHGGFSKSVSVAKFSGDGNVVWSRHFSNPFGAFSLADITVLADGKIAVCGSVYHSDSNRPGLFFAGFDGSGNLLFAREYDLAASIFYFSESIKSLSDGGFVVAGYGNGIGAFILRLSPSGDIIWSKSVGGFFLPDIIVLNDNELVACGESDDAGWLIKISQDGALIWDKRYSTPQNHKLRLDALLDNGHGGFIAAGNDFEDPAGIVMSLDSTGEVAWSRKYKGVGSGFFSDIEKFQDKGYLLGGQTYQASGNSERAAWFLKTDLLGRTGDCGGESYPLSATNGLPQIEDISFIEVPAHQPINDSIPVNDWQGLRDTICPFTCAVLVEICNNNLDDDGDGLFDCLDAECNCAEERCAPTQANVWYFGTHAGLDFSTAPPTVLTDGMTEAFGISATMSDYKGDILFYTDGKMVYNRFHQPMPNGDLLLLLAAHHSMIIPNPGNNGLFYVVTGTPGAKIHFSVVDMTLDNGRGDIQANNKNVLLSGISGGLAAVKACSFNGYWLLTRTIESDSKFLAYRIDENGLSAIPVISNSAQGVGTVRQLKISPDGKRVACTYYQHNNFTTTYVSIYGFDPYAGGTVFNPRILEMIIEPGAVAGVEFSPSGRLLYVTGDLPGSATLAQFDLEAGNLANIIASKFVLATAQNPETSYPQLAPNGQIYLPPGNSFTPIYFALDVIQQPNQPGIACQFQEQGLLIQHSTGGGLSSLCNVISSALDVVPYIAFPYNAPDTICDLNTPIYYQIPNVQCNVDSITWKSENLNVQIEPNYQYATVRYLAPGAGQLIVTAHTYCGATSDTLDVLVVAPVNKDLELGPDLLVCQNGVFSFNAGSGFARYQWSDGTADSTTTTLFSGKYWVTVWDLCGNMQSDTIQVSVAPNTVLNLGPDLPQQCSGISASYQRPANFDSWQWSPNEFLSCTDCPGVTVSPTISATWIIIAQTAEGCISVDTLSATIRDTLIFSRDTSVCIGQTLALFGAQLPADTMAQFFLPAPGIGCDTLLTVNVLGIENSAFAVNTIICANDVFDYNGVLLPPDTVVFFHLNSALACDSVVTVTVNSYPPLNLTLPMDTTIRVGASVLLEAKVNGTGTLDFAWSPANALSCVSCLTPLANPLDSITYTFAVTDMNGCTAIESVTIRVNEECRVLIPNAFTPNGDGANDRFRPITDPCVRTIRLWRIVNRWGQTVFEQYNFPAADPALGWDGIWEGKPHSSDVLIWVAEFEYYDGRLESQRGEVTLVR